MDINEGKKYYESKMEKDQQPWDSLPERIKVRYAEVAALLPIDTVEKAQRVGAMIKEELGHIRDIFDQAIAKMEAKRNGEGKE